MKSLVLALCLSAFSSASLSVFAAEAEQQTTTISQPQLNELFHMRLAIQKSIGDFYMFNSQEQDQHYATRARDNLAQAIDYLNKMPVQNEPNAQTLIIKMQRDLNTYSEQLNELITAITELGYSDLQPIADLAAVNSSILKAGQDLQQLIMQEHQYSPPELTLLAREQSILILEIAADYAARSASIGASFFAVGEKKPLDQLSEEFASNLQTLQNNPHNTDGTGQSLRAIQVKWRYIESSLKNYNEDSVPFVIDKYARSIAQSLEQLATQYALLNI